ncbi:MAG TPA: hypothetical protein VGG75_38665 [Trebonia sp.]|jgi:hypothetical protein
MTALVHVAPLLKGHDAPHTKRSFTFAVGHYPEFLSFTTMPGLLPFGDHQWSLDELTLQGGISACVHGGDWSAALTWTPQGWVVS